MNQFRTPLAAHHGAPNFRASASVLSRLLNAIGPWLSTSHRLGLVPLAAIVSDMRVLIVAQYYAPESVGTPLIIRELALGLKERGHQVTVLTAFPNYPKRVIFDGYRRKLYMRETMEGIEVVRTYIYANPSNSNLSRIMNWGSFSVSALIGGVFARIKPDVVYSVAPPLSMGAASVLIAKAKKCPLVTNVMDLYPLIAVELGILKNRRLIRFFERMESYMYRNSRALVGISEGFRAHFMHRGVPVEGTHVVGNWADTDLIQPGPKDNEFRRAIGVGDNFTVLYSGGLTYNSNLEPLVEAAKALENEPIRFVIVGEGVRKTDLVARARELDLKNFQFLPFQPFDLYAEVLRASDITVVALSSAASLASVPSKVYKQMAAGRPVLAITQCGNELDRLVRAAKCGLQVEPDDSGAVVQALRWALAHRDEIERMGPNARAYVKQFHDRSLCISQIEQILLDTIAAQSPVCANHH